MAASVAEAGQDLPKSAAAADVQLEEELLSSGIGAQACAGEGDAYTVPVIDMSMSDEACTAAMWEAATTVGFFTVVNHGISEELVDRALSRSAAFFEQPRAAKEAQSPYVRELNSGFEHMAQVRPSSGVADHKESLQVTARSGAMDGRWPSQPADFQDAAKTLMQEAHALGCRILSLLEAGACPTLPPGTLASSHTLWGDDGQCTLRLLHYMPMEAETAQLLADSKEQHWRAAPHTDWCCCTLLFQRPGNEGLECASNPRAGRSQWTAVDPVPGGIAVNIGDMLRRWSANRLLSNLHRVRLPRPEECVPPRPRYSMAFFMQADKHCVIKSECFEPITAGDYLLGRIRSSFGAAPTRQE